MEARTGQRKVGPRDQKKGRQRMAAQVKEQRKEEAVGQVQKEAEKKAGTGENKGCQEK